MQKWFFVILLIIGVGHFVNGQDFPRQNINFDLLLQELVAQQEEENLNYEDIYENLFQYYQHPINLNQATADELTALFLLTPQQITALLTYKSENGPLLSIYELQAVPGFDLSTIYKIVPFVTVQDMSLLQDRRALRQRISENKNQAFLLRYDRTLQKRKGYTPPDSIGTRLTSRYLGSPNKYVLRYRNSHAQDFSVGFTIEKDAGEQMAWNPAQRQYGADFYSAHVQVYNQGKFKALALGDYQLQFGQGLLLSAGFFVGKGSETITTIRRSNIGIRPFTSVLESAFFRGAAITYSIRPHLESTTFYSRKKVDAALRSTLDTLTNENDFFSGIQASGFHRTPTELGNKHQVGEQVMGNNITFKAPNQNFSAGLTLVYTHFTRRLQRRPALYNYFEFTGQDNVAGSMNYSYSWQNINVFGETGISGGGGWGSINGLLASLTKNIDLSLVYRNYGKSFHSFYGQAFGENTRNSNEKGLYTGIKIKPFPKWEVTAYYDLFRFPWLKYRVDAPSAGDEYLVRVLYKPTKSAQFYGQLRGEIKSLNTTGESKLHLVLPATRHQYLLYLDYSPTATLNLRSRIQLSQYEHAAAVTKGYYIGQEINTSIRKNKVAVSYALFDTDDYDTRLYVPEHDVLYAFSVPALSGTGTRMYVLWHYPILPQLDGWFKITQTQYRYQKTIGSGLEEIAGPNRTDIRCQLRYRLN